MELGFDFDDDDFFETPKDKQPVQQLQSSHNLNICEPLWFYGETKASDDPNDYLHLKYIADHEYSVQQFDRALCHYRQCRARLKNIGTATWRDVEEGKARCLMKLGQYQDALECANEMSELAQNVDQITAVLHLLLDIQKSIKNTKEQVILLKKLLTLHPTIPSLWMQLGELNKHNCGAECKVLKLSPDTHVDDQECQQDRLDIGRLTIGGGSGRDGHSEENSVSADCSLESTVDARTVTCYIVAQCLLERVHRTVTSFARSRNEQLQDEVRKKLENLHFSRTFYKDCLKFVQKSLHCFENDTSDTDEHSSSSHAILAKMTDETINIAAEFDDRWFSWYRTLSQLPKSS